MISEEIDTVFKHLGNEKLAHSLRIHTYVRSFLQSYLISLGFTEVPPVIISPITDPLNHPTFDPVFDYYGSKYSLTKSMIFHKQLMVRYLGSIFTFSPNVRLETADKASTGRHLSEFTQLDIEKSNATRDEMIHLVEDFFPKLLHHIKSHLSGDIEFFGRDLRIPKRPFRRIKFLDALSEYGKDFEEKLSSDMEEPFWIVDIPLESREFYDRLDDDSDTLVDMDLIYPEGFGEALSGGEREYLPHRIREHIRRKGQKEKQFELYLKFAETGLQPSAGFGIGIERLVRFITGMRRIEDVHPFPKIPGIFSV